MGTMEPSGSSAMPVSEATQGDHEERTRATTTSRLRGAETSKTPATKRRKRPISSLYTLDEWVNKTRGMGGEMGNPRRKRGSLLEKPGEGNTVKRGEEDTRLDTPSEETIDPAVGSGESRGLGALRLNKPRGMGMMRERTTPAKSGRLGRRPRVVTSSHNAKIRLET